MPISARTEADPSHLTLARSTYSPSAPATCSPHSSLRPAPSDSPVSILEQNANCASLVQEAFQQIAFELTHGLQLET
jgi:hypothetical protein